MQPEIWFNQTEVRLRARGITANQTMFNYVVALLEPEAACRVIGILLTLPANDKDTAIKNAFLGAYGLSDIERADAVLNMLPLGDEKPLELCCVAPGDTEHPIIKRIFCASCPRRP